MFSQLLSVPFAKMLRMVLYAHLFSTVTFANTGKLCLYNITIGNITTGSFTWTYDLHDLPTFKPKVSCDWISHLDPWKLHAHEIQTLVT